MTWMLATLVLLGQPEHEGPLTLARALELAEKHHQTSAIARAQVEQAEARRALAISALLPEVSVFGRYTRQPEFAFEGVVIQEENAIDGRVSANVTLLDAPSIVRIARASPTFESEKMRAEESVRSFRFDVARTFLAVLSMEQLAAAARNRIAVATRAGSDAKKRFEHGLAGDNDVTRASLELASAELAATDAEASVRELRLRLERMIGEAASAPLAEPAEVLSIEAMPKESLLEAAQLHRPDLLALKAEVEAARLAADEPLWSLVPSLSLDAFYQLTTQQAFTGENEGWGVSVSAIWTLYDRGRRYREHAERSAAAREASLRFERALEDARNEIDRSLVALERAKVALARAEARAALAKKNAEEVAIRYREGVATAFELTDSSAAEFAANAELARARFELGTSVLEVRRVSGAPPL